MGCFDEIGQRIEVLVFARHKNKLWIYLVYVFEDIKFLKKDNF